jgi:hypothetical protein
MPSSLLSPLLSCLLLLGVLVVASACSKPRTEDTTHVIPPAAPYVAAAAEAPPARPVHAPAPGLGVRALAGEEVPSAAEVKEFERPVSK